MKHGDFTGLAENYRKYRPGYSLEIAKIISREAIGNPHFQAVDVGAGTGIWTQILKESGVENITAIEPNLDMKTQGQIAFPEIEWIQAPAENTQLKSQSVDLVTMASSFHWPDFDSATQEFNRILKPGGLFVALWNPRLISVNPLLVEIENKLKELVPELKRVSSGSSSFTKDLSNKLEETKLFKDVVYLESKHVEKQSKERYIGLWESVNDIRVQAGEDRFNSFLDFIRDRIQDLDYIEATYLTRAWAARRHD